MNSLTEDVKMRDDFPAKTKELLAKRVAYICSNPKCQQATSGPQNDPKGSVNLGVAAHISAASPGGPRYDADMTQEQRVDSSNGIWLCQTCAKLIDNDPKSYSRKTLESWKTAAERTASMALTQGSQPNNKFQQAFANIERLMPELLNEMREDLSNNPTTREFVILEKDWIYNYDGFYLVYYYNEHDNLGGKLQVLENYYFIREITYNNVRRFIFQEEFINYLTA